MAHFDASVLSRESPVYGRSGLVSFCLQGRDFATESFFIGDTPVAPITSNKRPALSFLRKNRQ